MGFSMTIPRLLPMAESFLRMIAPVMTNVYSPSGTASDPHRFVKIRHYGLHAPANAKTRLETARRVLEAERPDLSSAITGTAAPTPATDRTDPPAVEDWRALLRRLSGIDPTRCKRCGGLLRCTPLSVLPRRPPDDTS
jgi:hypothetical protein